MKLKHFSSSVVRDVPLSYAVCYDLTTDDCPGRLESIEERLERVARLLGTLVDQLPEAAQKEIAETLFYWRPVK